VLPRPPTDSPHTNALRGNPPPLFLISPRCFRRAQGFAPTQQLRSWIPSLLLRILCVLATCPHGILFLHAIRYLLVFSRHSVTSRVPSAVSLLRPFVHFFSSTLPLEGPPAPECSSPSFTPPDPFLCPFVFRCLLFLPFSNSIWGVLPPRSARYHD